MFHEATQLSLHVHLSAIEKTKKMWKREDSTASLFLDQRNSQILPILEIVDFGVGDVVVPEEWACSLFLSLRVFPIWNDKEITVRSRVNISTNPSSTFTTRRCLVAIVMKKMKTNVLWKKDSIAILQKHQVDMHVLQGLQTVDRAFVGLVALEGYLLQCFACLLRLFNCVQ